MDTVPPASTAQNRKTSHLVLPEGPPGAGVTGSDTPGGAGARGSAAGLVMDQRAGAGGNAAF